MMTKKDFKEIADTCAYIQDANQRADKINFLIPILKSQNYRFDESRFREWIDRRVNRLSTKGLG